MAALPTEPLSGVDRPRGALYVLDFVPVAEANARALAARRVYLRSSEGERYRDLPTPDALAPLLRGGREGQHYDMLLSGIIDRYGAYELPLPKAVLARELLDLLPTPGGMVSDRAAELVRRIAGTRTCRGCAREFIAWSVRVSHCSDACRRAHAVRVEHERRATAIRARAAPDPHRAHHAAPPPGSACARPGCGLPLLPGQAKYCSQGCCTAHRRLRRDEPTGRTCARPGCDRPLPRQNRTYCSRACQQVAFGAQIAAILHRGRKAGAQ